MKRYLLAVVAILVGFAAGAVSAQDFPSKPIRIIMPTPAGSSSDMLARMLAEQLGKDTKASVIVENKPGALGTIGAEHVLNAPADGYTALLSSVSTHAQVPYLMKKVSYDPIKDWEPVCRLAVFEWLIVAAPRKGYDTLRDLVDASRKEPGKLSFAYGTASALAGVTEFNKMAGIEAVGAGYKGQPPALVDVASGVIDYMLVDANVALPLIQAKRVTPLAVASPTRAYLLPDVPTMAEAGLPAFEFIGWVGLSVPAKTPAAAIRWLSDNTQAAFQKPEFTKRLINAAITPAYMPTAEFGSFVEKEVANWGERIRAAGIQPE